MRIARSSCVLRPCDSYRWLLAVLAIAAALALNACGRSDAQSYAGGKQLVILGIDGMDPGFLGRHWDQLPNLARLRNEGDFRPLATVMPPQSPVVWSTFITGTDPGDTGIYDFIHRHPDTLSLYSSMAQTVERGSTLPVGPYRLPLSSGAVRNLRHGTPFWKILSDHGVPVTILRMPTNFPPVDAGRAVPAWELPTSWAPSEPSPISPTTRQRRAARSPEAASSAWVSTRNPRLSSTPGTGQQPARG